MFRFGQVALDVPSRHLSKAVRKAAGDSSLDCRREGWRTVAVFHPVSLGVRAYQRLGVKDREVGRKFAGRP